MRIRTGSALAGTVAFLAVTTAAVSASAQQWMAQREILVTARSVGVPVWHVESAAGRLVLMPSDAPLPAEDTARIDALERTLRSTDQIMYPGRTTINITPWAAVGYYMQWRRMVTLPTGHSLQQMMTAPDFARL